MSGWPAANKSRCELAVPFPTAVQIPLGAKSAKTSHVLSPEITSAGSDRRHPEDSRLIARSRAFAAAADVWFGDDDSAPRAIVRPSCEGQFWPTDGLCLICDPVHRREDGRQLKIVPVNSDGRHAGETNRTNLERGQSCDASRSLCRIAAFPRVCSAAGGSVPGRG